MVIIDNLKTKYLPKNFFVSTSNFFQPVFNCYLANSKSEIRKAQRLRYKIFFNDIVISYDFSLRIMVCFLLEMLVNLMKFSI